MQHRHFHRRAAALVLSIAALSLATAQPAEAAGRQVALWNMSDSGATMHDSSGHGHDGDLHGVTTGRTGYTGTGKAFGFFGDPSFAQVPDSSELNPSTSTFSFTMHIKLRSRPSDGVEDFDVLRKGLGSTEGGSYKLEILSSGTAFCDFRGSSADGSVSSSAALSVASWHTVTCARTATAVRVTVDGHTRSRSVSTGTIKNSGSLYIGARSSQGGDQYRGTVDAVSVTKG